MSTSWGEWRFTCVCLMQYVYVRYSAISLYLDFVNLCESFLVLSTGDLLTCRCPVLHILRLLNNANDN